MSKKEVESEPPRKGPFEAVGGDSASPSLALEVNAENSLPQFDRKADSPQPSAPGKKILEGTKFSVALPVIAVSSAAAAGDCRSFSQLMAGAMASTAAIPRPPILAVPVDAARLPVVAVPCILAPAALLESHGFMESLKVTGGVLFIALED